LFFHDPTHSKGPKPLSVDVSIEDGRLDCVRLAAAHRHD
jgi:hypothetical protein